MLTSVDRKKFHTFTLVCSEFALVDGSRQTMWEPAEMPPEFQPIAKT